MHELVQKILSELAELDAAVKKSRADAGGDNRQMDLEVAILQRQIADLRAKNAAATEFINQATGILEKLRLAA